MLNPTKHQPIAVDETETTSFAIKIVIVADSAHRAVRARELSEQLARELRAGMVITSEVWRFNFLRLPDVRYVAAASAAHADIVVVSAHDDGELPDHVKMWIEDWVTLTRHGPTSLVALLDRYAEIPGNAASLCAYLRRTARRASMDFYLKAGDGWEPNFERVAIDELEPQEDAVWALNEVAFETALFRSGSPMLETTGARLNIDAHSTAVS